MSATGRVSSGVRWPLLMLLRVRLVTLLRWPTRRCLIWPLPPCPGTRFIWSELGRVQDRRNAGLQSPCSGRDASLIFTAVDVSEALAGEAARAVEGVIGKDADALVADFLEVPSLLSCISEAQGERRQVFTGFGLSPNLAPADFFFPGFDAYWLLTTRGRDLHWSAPIFGRRRLMASRNC